MEIGKKMKQLRLAKDWTLAELAKHSGVALSTLSRIETNRMTGTLESHIQIAQSLGVRLAELYADLDSSEEKLEVRRASDPPEKVISIKGASMALLADRAIEKKMLPALVTVKPRQSAVLPKGQAGSERFLYLLKGQLEISTADEKAVLKHGDSLYTQAARPQTLKNTGSTPALALALTCPPAI